MDIQRYSLSIILLALFCALTIVDGRILYRVRAPQSLNDDDTSYIGNIITLPQKCTFPQKLDNRNRCRKVRSIFDSIGLGVIRVAQLIEIGLKKHLFF